MLPLFSQLLKDYLVQQQVAPEDRIKFGAPDRDFVLSLPTGKSVNIYLVEINENRKLRGNERQRTKEADKETYQESLYPAWIDAHYLISAWDSAIDSNSKALSEQEILDEICAFLLAGDPFSPQSVYSITADHLKLVADARQQAEQQARDNGLSEIEIRQAGDDADKQKFEEINNRLLETRNAWPKEFHVPGLPYRVMPPEGFPKLSEFWTTMGTGSPWKPIIYLVATIPIGLKPAFEYPIVTTLTSRIGQTGNALGYELIEADPNHYADVPLNQLSAEERKRRLRDEGTVRVWRQIGGTLRRVQLVLDPATGQPIIDPATGAPKQVLRPVAGVKVRLEMAVLQPAQAAADDDDFTLLQETRSYEPRKLDNKPATEEERDKEGRFQFLYLLPLAKHDCRFRLVFQATRVPGDHPGQPINLKQAELAIEPSAPVPSPYDVVMTT